MKQSEGLCGSHREMSLYDLQEKLHNLFEDGQFDRAVFDACEQSEGSMSEKMIYNTLLHHLEQRKQDPVCCQNTRHTHEQVRISERDTILPTEGIKTNTNRICYENWKFISTPNANNHAVKHFQCTTMGGVFIKHLSSLLSSVEAQLLKIVR